MDVKPCSIRHAGYYNLKTGDFYKTCNLTAYILINGEWDKTFYNMTAHPDIIKLSKYQAEMFSRGFYKSIKE